ncbi:hypothetical protein YC2023_007064 [Brassica napus]
MSSIKNNSIYDLSNSDAIEILLSKVHLKLCSPSSTPQLGCYKIPEAETLTLHPRIQRNKMIKLCAKRCLQYCRRGFTSVASSFKHGWEEQNKVVLGFVFMGGWFGQSIISKVL